MVSAVLGAIPQMANVAALLFFLLAMFALIGNQLFMNLFNNRCFSTVTGSASILIVYCQHHWFDSSLISLARVCARVAFTRRIFLIF